MRSTCNAGVGYGYSNACYELGEMLEKGDGIKADKVEAVRLYKKACNQGKHRHTKACFAIERLGK